MAKEKILIVDDSPLVRKLAEVSLQEAEYEVYTASDGEEGLKIAEEIKPDLILVDFIMPKMTGSQFCKLIRENEILKDIPIILITGKGETVGQTFIEKYQVLDYFIKPFKSEDLIEKVRTTLNKVPQFISEMIPEVSQTTAEISEPLSEIEVKEVEEEQPSLEISQVEEIFSAEQKEPLQLLEEKEILDEIVFEEPQDLTKEIDLEELKESIEISEESELEVPEKLAMPEIEEIKPARELLFEEETVQPEVEEFQSEEEILKEETPADSLSNLEKLIEDKFNSFSEKIITLFDNSVEGILKKHGFIKDSSLILSGDLNFFKLSEIFLLINSNGLTGIFTIYGKGEIYEFLFINGLIIYGISNFQKQKMGFKLLNELSQEQIKNITFEAMTTLRESQLEHFIFEKKDFTGDWLLNKEGYNPLELFKETLK